MDGVFGPRVGEMSKLSTMLLDLELMKAPCAGPHDDGAGKAADAPGGPDVGEHAPEEP